MPYIDHQTGMSCITPWHGNLGEPNWRWMGKKEQMRADEAFARQERNSRDTIWQQYDYVCDGLRI